MSASDKKRLRKEQNAAAMTEKQQKAQAEAKKLKLEVEQWLNTIPNRMQRIIRYRVFEGLEWKDVAHKIGRKATADSVRMEYANFLK